MTASWTALLRLARRDALRHPARALLVVLLIAAPVAGLIMAATVQATVTPTDDERARQALGSGDLAVHHADGPVAPADIAGQLPTDTRVERYWPLPSCSARSALRLAWVQGSQWLSRPCRGSTT